MADTTVVPPSGQTPKPAKRSFFKKPAWATAEETKTESPQTGPDAFRHSNRVFQEILEEQQQKDQEKARKKEKEERRKKRKSDDTEGTHVKRRRASRENEGSESPARRGSSKESSRTPDLTSPSRIATRSTTNPASLSARYEDALKSSILGKNNAPSNIIDLGSDSDDSSIAATFIKAAPRTTAAMTVEDDSDADSDLEYRSIALQMRERSQPEFSPARPKSTTAITNSPPKPDPVVSILITSPIPDTKPLLVSRKLSQTLKQVREVWCSRQAFPPGITPDKVFLTYRNRRLWDIGTCKSMGLQVDANGTLRQRDEGDVFDDMDGRVHLVAVTPEILADIKRRAELGLDDSDSEEEKVQEEEEAVTEPSKVRLILKAKGLEEFRLSVNPDSTFEKVANAFRIRNKVAADKQIYLMFDGERLEPQDAVKDSEIEDMDGVEVHFK